MNSLQDIRRQFVLEKPKIFEEIASLRPTKKELLKVSKEVKDRLPHLEQFHQVIFEKGEENNAPLRVGVVLSGGPAAGGHNVIAGVYDALNAFHQDHLLIGFIGGPSGIVNNKFKILDRKIISQYRNLGGFDMIGTGRTKIETPEQFEKCLETVDKNKLDGLIVIGGDDSNTNAALLADYFASKKSKTVVIGVPKTIDGDLKNNFIEASFGFDSAAKTYSELVGNILRDARSQGKYTFFIKIMGRTASHLLLECALQTQPNLALISEEIAERKKTLSEIVKEITDLVVERSKAGKDYSVILIPEGLVEFIPDFEKSISSFPQEIQAQFAMERDPHGNLQVSKIETERLFITLVSEELKKRADFKGKFSPQPLFFGYEGRSCLPSNFDANYTYNLGLTAALLVKYHFNGYMAVVSSLEKPTTFWEPMGIPLATMIEMKTKDKPVIRKALVDLKGNPFKIFVKEREAWKLADNYLIPGPIQFFGPTANNITKTLNLEKLN